MTLAFSLSAVAKPKATKPKRAQEQDASTAEETPTKRGTDSQNSDDEEQVSEKHNNRKKNEAYSPRLIHQAYSGQTLIDMGYQSEIRKQETEQEVEVTSTVNVSGLGLVPDSTVTVTALFLLVTKDDGQQDTGIVSFDHGWSRVFSTQLYATYSNRNEDFWLTTYNISQPGKKVFINTLKYKNTDQNLDRVALVPKFKFLNRGKEFYFGVPFYYYPIKREMKIIHTVGIIHSGIASNTRS